MPKRRGARTPGPGRAGHSVNVLLQVYAKCVVGQDEHARKLIAEALTDPRLSADAHTTRTPIDRR
ncbi:hypothetical protein GCM10017673_32680 [Streptosporangium violaceochromogenes]|nr:hypothetical protein GCM10017673_32680 [Streptosporangium violaceochromogenes]